MKDNKFKPTIGLEVHCELRTRSKLFCGCPADHFGKPPNTQTCPVCLGLPGELPVANKTAVEWTILLGLALNCEVNKEPKFDRKHYFYPDLPMGFQISQYDEPFALGGFIETSEGRVNLTRVHLEIDTGKLQHANLDGENVSLVDFNRSGVALMEIVTEPEIHSASQAKEFAKKLQQIIRYLEISDCDMEKGSMRLEANISWGLELGYKVEVKNLNSFRFLEKAIEYELDRQEKALEAGESLSQETRGWNQTKQVTFNQRYKETAEDYRYIPDPDLPPMTFDDKFINSLWKSLPELPDQKVKRFVAEFNLRKDYAEILVADKKTARKVEEIFILAKREKINADSIANYVVNHKIDLLKISPQKIINTLKEKSYAKISDEKSLNAWLKEALSVFPSAVYDYKKGKTNAISVLIGKVMQLSKGKADPSVVRQLLEEHLKK